MTTKTLNADGTVTYLTTLPPRRPGGTPIIRSATCQPDADPADFGISEAISTPARDMAARRLKLLDLD